MAAAYACAAPAAAQQPLSGAGPPPQQRLMLQRPPGDVGSPPSFDPRLATTPEPNGDCAPPWRCRLQLFGIIEKNGGVGLKGTALTW
jgi:hypothetical protein